MNQPENLKSTPAPALLLVVALVLTVYMWLFLHAESQPGVAALLPALVPNIPSAYKDVFAFGVVIVLMAWKPTGLLAEKTSERV